MFNKDFSLLNADDLKGLINAGVLEGNNLEFKKQVWTRDDEGIREMMRDVSSLANAYGGYLIIGMDEDTSGKATQLIEIPEVELERDRILASCMANLQPRIIGLDIRSIEFETGKKVLVLKIPRDIHIHQITFKGMYQFWKRHDRQKNKMTYEEIKESITKENFSITKTDDFIRDRKTKVNTGESVMMLSALPLKLENEILRIDNSELRTALQDSSFERTHGWGLNFRGNQPRPTLNGLKIEGYKQIAELYRNGYFEVLVNIEEGYFFEEKEVYVNGATVIRKQFRNTAIVELTYSFLNKLKIITSIIGYDSPYVFSINLFHIRDFVLPEYHHGSHSFSSSRIWENENLELPLVTFETLNPKMIAKELCDRIWQAFGYEKEPYFIDGEFKF